MKEVTEIWADTIQGTVYLLAGAVMLFITYRRANKLSKGKI